MKLTVVIPMYNEEKNAAACIASLRELAQAHAEREYEFLLVNDGSSDHTELAVREAIADDARFRLLSYTPNQGKGCAVRTGMLEASGDAVLFTDCDLAYGTEAIDRMARQWEESGDDIVIGSRNLSPDGYEGYTLKRRIMSKTYIKLLSVAAGFRHSDSQSGIKCFGGAAAKEIFGYCRVNRFAFDLEALLIAERLGYTVGEMPVKVIHHAEGESKVNAVRDTLRMLRDIRAIRGRIAREIPAREKK